MNQETIQKVNNNQYESGNVKSDREVIELVQFTIIFINSKNRKQLIKMFINY